MIWLRIDAGLWFLFAVVWFVAAPFSRRTVHREPLGSRLMYALPLALGFALMFSARLAGYLPALTERVVPDAEGIVVAGVALTVAGIGFAFWARACLGRLWSGSITLKEGHRLVDDGPYALARHPIYTGIIFAALGSVLVVGTVAAIVGFAVAAASLVVKLGREDALMASQFGEQHAEYRVRVKRLIPFVW